MQVESVIQAYKRGKYYMEASDIYEEQKEYLDSIQVLIDHKLYVEAASKAKKLENSGMSLKKHILWTTSSYTSQGRESYIHQICQKIY